jgi:hypothetical protein
VKDKSTLRRNVGDEDKTKDTIKATQASKGQDIFLINLIKIKLLAWKVARPLDHQKHPHFYSVLKIHDMALNCASVVDEMVGEAELKVKVCMVPF